MKVKVIFFQFLLILGFLILWLRLFYLQVIKGKEYRLLAEGNRIKILRESALRGVIYDRKGEVLVRNRPEGREYIYSETLAHVLGFLGQADEQEIKQFREYPLSNYANLPNQDLYYLVGKAGIEQAYDNLLRGEDGGTLVETDAFGKIVRQLYKQEPQEGKSLTLVLDLGLQKLAYQLIKDYKGAVIASNPNTGEIYALASSPSFDPNILTPHFCSNANQSVSLCSADPKQQQLISNIFNNSDKPLFNRAIAGLYPPGSTFKIVTGLAGLAENKINESTLVMDTGEINVGGSSFGNWYFRQYGKTEGLVDIFKAYQRSNDIYFYKVGEWSGITKLAQWAKFLGLGTVTGIDINGEANGLIPTPAWKKETKLEDWYLGDTYITAIGQGDLQTTPLQVNQMASVIANDGKLCRPYLYKGSDEKDNCQDLKIKREYIDIIKEGMKLACSTGGTGWPFFNFKVHLPADATALQAGNAKLKDDKRFNTLEGDWVEVPVACKTGTAEFGHPQDKTHAWFTVFAPYDKPEVVVTVLLEGAGEGSSVAGPVAKELLNYWFKNK